MGTRDRALGDNNVKIIGPNEGRRMNKNESIYEKSTYKND